MQKSAFIISTFALLFIHSVSHGASAFNGCPSNAYLIQTPSSSPMTYSVDLATGSYSIKSNNMGTAKVNGVGFNLFDSYMYGWDYSAGTLALIGSDYQTVPLNVNGLIGKPFFVGDTALVENAWYGYRPNYGLYRIALDSPFSQLTLEHIATHTFMGSPSITDFAFRPGDGMLWAVDNNGYLIRITPSTGKTEVITQVLSEAEEGFNFTFGAQYFDIFGNLYISNNGNGYIYRIGINGVNSKAYFFTYGPSSSSNDGARCAMAEIEISEEIDFGDAPESYGTSMASSGARHALSSLYLGSKVDGESTAYVHPLSDDNSDGSDDDDGIIFISGFAVEETSFIQIQASATGGYLNAWIDWDADGSFDADEKIASAIPLTDGYNMLNVTVPVWANIGDTWARFRISTKADILPIGGVGNGEVEDYLVNITENGVGTIHYPSQTSFTTFAFEDLYPATGDFDMNDVLMNVRITEYIKDNRVIRIRLDGQLAAMGASYRNGFAMQLPGISPNNIKGDSIALWVDGTRSENEILEQGQSDAVLIVSDDLWAWVEAGESGCKYFRSETGCGTSYRTQWTMIIPFINPVAPASMPARPYDPFIFARPGSYHGDTVSAIIGNHPGRAFEVHLKNHAPTDTFNTLLFGKIDDASSAGSLLYFLTTNGMPWALELPMNWQHPKEGRSILETYPQFSGFAGDSSGQTNPNWYLNDNANTENIFID
ncbi:MAG: LruC domain-containing protein [Pseudomonadales bacterium]|nr:LruC domain-containing protein [Pseudomonadales bacterium]